MRNSNDWGKPVIVTSKTTLSAKGGRVIAFLRESVERLKPTNAEGGFSPRVELKSTPEKSRARLSALHSARKRLVQEDKKYDSLKFKLQGDTVLIWLEA